MFTTQRRFASSVIQRFLEAPHRFQFFQAVMLLELWLRRNGVVNDEAIADCIKFQNSISLSFPASEIESIAISPELPANSAESVSLLIQKRNLESISLTTPFIGFLGSNGTLPAHYTERISRHQLLEKDAGPRAFLDVFSSRGVTLFFKAWRKYRLEFQYRVDGKDSFLALLLSLSGMGSNALRERFREEDGDLSEESIAYFSTAIRHRPPSAAYLQQVLREYFDATIEVEQFVGHWYMVPDDQQTSLGITNATLGHVAMVGARVWQRNLRLRMHIGPLMRKQFISFLPGGSAARSLKKIITMFSACILEYEIRLILSAKEVQGIHLSSEGEGGRLGWDTFLVSTPAQADRTDVRYEIHAI
ncbi:type VI secretion system baseplate subunit TssG [Herbaspirillum sp. RTI4]|uniref:type VI secretion system baseplate subunit TssG n=1 Tax=Herbaspirillum sp. RTI4 TaxID=3048640 RepID=UPI002AB4B628|nr:type VI secretion system baseplate subunit TssG [Herbaspirillum sp. RTI4]MDY7579025.1 type VI secretion system baseplate subunit TssG [Herbaspirillum sp. RTI4]MEA9980956.1 type VI secretion system baseplate subunit TssG [Herbaspirillum sp. RTI4]